MDQALYFCSPFLTAELLWGHIAQITSYWYLELAKGTALLPKFHTFHSESEGSLLVEINI